MPGQAQRAVRTLCSRRPPRAAARPAPPVAAHAATASAACRKSGLAAGVLRCRRPPGERCRSRPAAAPRVLGRAAGPGAFPEGAAGDAERAGPSERRQEADRGRQPGPAYGAPTLHPSAGPGHGGPGRSRITEPAIPGAGRRPHRGLATSASRRRGGGTAPDPAHHAAWQERRRQHLISRLQAPNRRHHGAEHAGAIPERQDSAETDAPAPPVAPAWPPPPEHRRDAGRQHRHRGVGQQRRGPFIAIRTAAARSAIADSLARRGLARIAAADYRLSASTPAVPAPRHDVQRTSTGYVNTRRRGSCRLHRRLSARHDVLRARITVRPSAESSIAKPTTRPCGLGIGDTSRFRSPVRNGVQQRAAERARSGSASTGPAWAPRRDSRPSLGIDMADISRRRLPRVC